MRAARLRLALAALGAALGVYAICLAIWKPGAVTLPIAVHVAIGWSFIAAGFVAWKARPDNRTGLLMMLTGTIWFGRDFDWWGAAVPSHLSDLSQNVFLAAVSQRTATLLADYFHRHDVRVIPNGVDTAQFSPPARLALRAEARRRRAIHETDFVLLLIGNDWRVKGLETVLRAMSSLPGLPFLAIAAGDDFPSPFSEIAKTLGISERCRFEPSRDDVLDFYAVADLYVSPSREDSFGLPVAEAMACGLPVITSADAGVADLIRDGMDGFILRHADDFHGLAKMLQQLHVDEHLRGNVGAAAAKAALQWTWDQNAADVCELLKDSTRKKLSLTGPRL